MSITVIREPMPELPAELKDRFTAERFPGGAWTDCRCIACGSTWRVFDAKGERAPSRLDPHGPLREHLAVKHGVVVVRA